MPSKSKGQDGVKHKGRSKSDKARRNFELNGKYSAKHRRQVEEKTLNGLNKPPMLARTRSQEAMEQMKRLEIKK